MSITEAGNDMRFRLSDLGIVDSGNMSNDYGSEGDAENNGGSDIFLDDLDADRTTDKGPSDSDGDGVLDAEDNCVSIVNPNQTDANGNGIGDACEVSPEDINDDCEWVGGVCMASCNDDNFRLHRGLSYIYPLANSEYMKGGSMNIGCFDVCTDPDSDVSQREVMFLTRYELIDQFKPDVRWFRNNQEFSPIENGSSETINHQPGQCIRYSAVAKKSDELYEPSREDEAIQGSESFSISVYYMDRRAAGMSIVTLSGDTTNVYYQTHIDNSYRASAESNTYSSLNLFTRYNSTSDGPISISGSCESATRIQKYPAFDGLQTVFVGANEYFILIHPALGLDKSFSLRFAMSGEEPRLSYGPGVCQLQVNILGAAASHLATGELLNISREELEGLIVPGSFLWTDTEQAIPELNVEVGVEE